MNLVAKIRAGIRPRSQVMVALLDIEKAYDKVRREALLHKMASTGIPWQWTKLIQNWLTDRSFQVKFTDDTAIVSTAKNESSTTNKLKKGLEEIKKYAERGNIKINAEKTALSENKEKREVPGSGIGQQLNFQRHTELRAGFAKRRIGKLFPILKENSGFSLKARMTILKTIAIPMALYGQEIWVKGSPKAIKTMQKTQLILARKCSGVPWFTRNSELTKELRLEDVEKTTRERGQQAITSMKNHPAKSVRCRATKLE
ncbi:hypothetical protein Trydic_g6781 [Trypoxylus dichotomus]